MCSWSNEGFVIASQCHGDEAHGYRAGFGYLNLLAFGFAMKALG